MTRLVLLPGLDGTGELFAPFVAALDGFPAQVISYPPERAMNYAAHELHVRPQLPRDEDYVLLAESFSGPVGISIAAAAPPRLKALVLCASFAANPLPVFGPLSSLIRVMPAARVPPVLTEPWLYAGRGTPQLRRAHATAMSKVSAKVLSARVAAVLAVDHRALLARIAVPMLYLQASKDRLIPDSAASAILQVRPDVKIAEVEAPHFLLQTEPSKCVAAVMNFLFAHGIVDQQSPEFPDPPLTPAQAERVARLTSAELEAIDAELLAQAAPTWRKVARLVGMAIGELGDRIPHVQDVFYAQRVKQLVARGQLDSQGNLDYMRYSEVRLSKR